MKHILFLSLIIAALVANAQEFQVNVVEADPNLEIKIQGAETEAQAVQDCVGCNANPSLAPQPVATIAETGAHLDRMSSSEGWQNACTEFVQDGQIGQYGEKIVNEVMKSQNVNIKKGDTDLVSLCPNYPVMDEGSKANVFLIILTSMAFEESTCNNNETARGPNGTARGFFQLHSGKEGSYGPECRNYDSRTPEGSITCAVSIINKEMGAGNLFDQGSHWDVLRPMRWDRKRKKYFPNPSYAQIRSAITEFPACYEKQSTAQNANTNVHKQLFQVMDKKIFHKSEVVEFDL
ncbi:hypothetical protein [Pseudobdellovibrio sp. HCB154]|uniref:hypothetical protein n=1 Tax=Pseudobdellovibrio sp. HCB154 TaxID=3386277 RepID=UPI003916EA24